VARREDAAARGPGRPAKPRRIRFGILVAIAVVISAAVMGGLSARAIAAHASCTNHPVLLNVAVTDDLAPAVGRVAQSFNRQQHAANGRCVEVQIAASPAATVAGQIDGQATRKGAAPDAWIPDSSLWVDVARSFPQGAQVIRPTGVDVARSPLMIATPQEVARKTRVFAAPVGWDVLLPAADGGPPAAMGLHVDLPDPTTTAAGLASLVELSRLLGHSPAARTAFTRFALSSEATSQFDDPNSLASFVTTAQPPFNGRPITVTSEQAVIAYDRNNPHQPLAAQYPAGFGAGLGTPVLDYPYVITTSSALQLEAAREFEQTLQGSYAAAVVRFAGFRSADGAVDATPASFGLKDQVLQHSAAATPSQAQTTLEVWRKLGLGSRDLVLIDTSAAMATPVAPNVTVEQELTKTSVLGLSLFSDSTQMGEWQVASHLHGPLPYEQLVPVGPLPADLGLITRRQVLEHIDETLQPRHAPLALYDSILAGYKQMLATYKPNYSNAVIVLTAGIDDPQADMSPTALVAKLHRLFNPNRKVEIVVLMIGKDGNFAALRQIADATGGIAFDITSPGQVGRAFIEGFSHRLCDTRCVAP
jgi:Ca-activated chloride channel family protein